MAKIRTRMLAALVVATWGAGARANGRFPSAQYVLVGPGTSSETVVLRATFGLMVSRDGGATFHWLCEEALGYAGAWDPPVYLARDGAIGYATQTALMRTGDLCTYAMDGTGGTTSIGDVSNDATGAVVYAVEANAGVSNHVWRSTNGGQLFVPTASGTVGLEWATIEASPVRPQRVYATGFDDTTRAYEVFWSDDTGATMNLGATDLAGGLDAYVAAADPVAVDRVWLRANTSGGSRLLRSDDRGRTVRGVRDTTGPMLGFAISDDGQRVWIGGPSDGLLRSDDAGTTFHPVSAVHVACLRYHAGTLWICGDWLRDGFALARWPDGASTFTPVLQFADATGPAICPAGTVENDTCGARWPGVQASVTITHRDAGLADTGSMDAITTDAGVPMDTMAGEPMAPPLGCGCHVGARSRSASWGWAMLLLVIARRRRYGAVAK